MKRVDINVNSGSYYARNRAMEESTGEFLAFVDADIKVPEDWLEKGIEALREAPYVAGNIVIDKEKVKSFSQFYEYKTAFPVEIHMRFRQFGPTGNLFVKREVFENIGGFDQRIWSCADEEFGDRIYRFTKYRQIYKKDLAVVHPPRNFWKIIKKAKRLAKGKKDIRTFYPQRFYSPKKSFFCSILADSF